MSTNLHPIFAQCLKVWAPPAEPIEVPSMAEQLADEHATGLDAVDLPDDWEPGQ